MDKMTRFSFKSKESEIFDLIVLTVLKQHIFGLCHRLVGISLCKRSFIFNMCIAFVCTMFMSFSLFSMVSLPSYFFKNETTRVPFFFHFNKI